MATRSGRWGGLTHHLGGRILWFEPEVIPMVWVEFLEALVPWMGVAFVALVVVNAVLDHVNGDYEP